jgi:hypothetical protein
MSFSPKTAFAAVALVSLSLAAFLAFSAFAGGASAGDGSAQDLHAATPSPQPAQNASLLFVKFHWNAQCASCTNLGAFTESTLRANYPLELASGRIAFADVNVEADPQNPLAEKYRPTHSSLYLITTRGGSEDATELAEAWYYTGDEQAFASYLKGVISSRLG